MADTDIEFLTFNIRVLSCLNLWPKKSDDKGLWRTIKDFSLISSVMPSYFAVLGDLIYQASGNFDDISGLTENLCALAAIMGTWYIVICFVSNRQDIQQLIMKLKDFTNVDSNQQNLFKTEKFAALFTKVFLVYGVIGIMTYCVVPLTQIEECKIKRAQSKYSAEIPCGLVTRCWFPPGCNVAPFIQIYYVHQVYTCLVVTSITLTITALLCGILMHIVTQIKYLRAMLKEACNDHENVIETRQKVRQCIAYHTMIIEYASNTKNAFTTMMLMHLTLTSFVISILGFEILSVSSLSDSLRFGLHMFGWISMLLLTCYYGQTLIDESAAIGADAYATAWYMCEVYVQKDIMLMVMRAQRPLTLTAVSLGVISLETFLAVCSALDCTVFWPAVTVMKTAYSYFTLLLNNKS